MTDHDALYRAIVARPEDDTPRLVYADWLEENGREEEAEFIRLECRLEALGPEQPEYVDLLDRQEELRIWLRTHSPGPQLKLGELGVGFGSDWWQWTSRGFPRYLSQIGVQGRLGIKGVRRLAIALEKAFRLIPTRRLFLTITLEDLPDFLKLPAIAALEHLTILTDDQRGDEAARLIANCRLLRNLRGIHVAFPVGEAGAEALSRSEQLGRIEWLVLDTANLTPAAIRSLGTGGWFRNLRTLMLEEALAADAFEELCRLPPCPNLHILDLSENSFPVSAWQEFARSKTFPQLTWLKLDGTDMSDGRMARLASANNFRLTTLDLSYCAIGNEGVRGLLAAPWVGSLQRLMLKSNRLTPSAATAIARCRKLTELKHLDLGGNPIGATGLKAIAGSSSLRNLTALHLGNCEAQNRTRLPIRFQEFLQKLNLPNLRYLDLSNMAIGARAARLLTDEKFRKLTRLGLAGCKLTDAATSALLTSPNLQNLIELVLINNSLKTGVELLTNRRILPRLSMCSLGGNPIAPDLYRKLARRPGVVVPD